MGDRIFGIIAAVALVAVAVAWFVQFARLLVRSIRQGAGSPTREGLPAPALT